MQKGLQEGLQKGWQEGLLEAVLQLVQARFALSDSDLDDLAAQLREVDDQVLRQLLLNTISVESADEFRTSLEEMKRSQD